MMFNKQILEENGTVADRAIEILARSGYDFDNEFIDGYLSDKARAKQQVAFLWLYAEFGDTIPEDRIRNQLVAVLRRERRRYDKGTIVPKEEI